MLVCLEVKSDQSTWEAIDSDLKSELGLVHTMWGADKDENRSSCVLPDNLFYAPGVGLTETGKFVDTFCSRITTIVRKHWQGAFKLALALMGTWRALSYTEATDE